MGTLLSLLIKAVVTVFGLGLLAVAARELWVARALSVSGEHVQGRVVALDERQDDEGTSWYLVAEFEAPPGTSHRIRGGIGSGRRDDYPTGQTVSIVYPTGNPEAGRIEMPQELWGPGLMALLGALLVLLPLASDWRARSRAKPSADPEEVLQSRHRWAARITRTALVVCGVLMFGVGVTPARFHFWVGLLGFSSFILAIPAYEMMKRCPRCGVPLRNARGERLAVLGAPAPCKECGMDLSSPR
jgi:hypothetical protein